MPATMEGLVDLNMTVNGIRGNVVESLMQTDQKDCYDANGRSESCNKRLQDGAVKAGVVWPEPRFETDGGTVLDHLTGRTWLRNANPAEFPLFWDEAFDFVRSLNRRQLHGHAGWRLPNRRELFSLVSHACANPSLPDAHPFTNVFNGYYWSASTCRQHPRQAWYVHMGGGRVFKGMKNNAYLVWPVRGGIHDGRVKLLQTGQRTCFDQEGDVSDCGKTDQDGAIRAGAPWPQKRFVMHGDRAATDAATGLMWHRQGALTPDPLDWAGALSTVDGLNSIEFAGFSDWRLPNIIELESLCHLDRYGPAVVEPDVFDTVHDAYWSGTTSVYDPGYAWVFYTEDGNIGVGYKARPSFHVLAVRSVSSLL